MAGGGALRLAGLRTGHLIELGELRLALLALLTGLGALGLARLLSLLPLLALLPHLAHLLSLGAGLLPHLTHLLALLALATGLRAHLAALLPLLALTTHLLTLASLALTHGIELGEGGTLAVGITLIAHALSLIHFAALALAVHAAFRGHAFAGAIDDHDGSTSAVATGTTAGAHAGIVGVVNYINRAGGQSGRLGHHVVAHLVHLHLVLARVDLVFDRTEEVGQILMLVAHVVTLIGQFLIGEIYPGKLLLEFLGIQLPGRLNG